MKIFKTAYLFPIFFIALGIYWLVWADYLEATLSFLAGLAFVFNVLASDPKFEKNKKTFGTITWILAGVSLLLFLWVLQFHTP
jgi:drug/metabolite transporter (DMT)-like permease